MEPRKPPIKMPAKTANAPSPTASQQAESIRKLEISREDLQKKLVELKRVLDSKVIASQKSEAERQAEKDVINLAVDSGFNLENFSRDEGLKCLFVFALNISKIQRDRLNMQDQKILHLNNKIEELAKIITDLRGTKKEEVK